MVVSHRESNRARREAKAQAKTKAPNSVGGPGLSFIVGWLQGPGGGEHAAPSARYMLLLQ